MKNYDSHSDEELINEYGASWDDYEISYELESRGYEYERGTWRYQSQDTPIGSGSFYTGILVVLLIFGAAFLMLVPVLIMLYLEWIHAYQGGILLLACMIFAFSFDNNTTNRSLRWIYYGSLGAIATVLYPYLHILVYKSSFSNWNNPENNSGFLMGYAFSYLPYVALLVFLMHKTTKHFLGRKRMKKRIKKIKAKDNTDV